MQPSTAVAQPMPEAHSRVGVAMDTLITIQITTSRPSQETDAAIERAFAWFTAVERACSRFDSSSELAQLCACWGEPVAVSDLLFQPVAFAIEVARLTGGAFDPTIGLVQERRGFDRNYRSGQPVRTTLPDDAVSFRDLVLDAERRTILLERPLLLDLGAVAKGLAVDLAAKELFSFERFAIDAGGDLYAGGSAPCSRPWRIGIRHPRDPQQLAGAVDIFNEAVCTSGDYERHDAEGGHHLLDPRAGRPACAAASVSVIAPVAIVADALATATFVLGPQQGVTLLCDQGLDGVIIDVAGGVHTTPRLQESFS